MESGSRGATERAPCVYQRFSIRVIGVIREIRGLVIGKSVEIRGYRTRRTPNTGATSFPPVASKRTVIFCLP
jgi:DNA primase